jgi:hypothetical protein
MIGIGDDFRASGVTLCVAISILICDRVMMGTNASLVVTDFHRMISSIRFSRESDKEDAKTANV